MQAISPEKSLDAGSFPYIISLLSKEGPSCASQSEFRTLFFKVTWALKPEFTLKIEENKRDLGEMLYILYLCRL